MRHLVEPLWDISLQHNHLSGIPQGHQDSTLRLHRCVRENDRPADGLAGGYTRK